jgi:hypothetical protein
MNFSTIIEYIVLTTVVIIIIHFYKYLYLDFYINFIQIPVFGAEALLLPPSLSTLYTTFFSTITSLTNGLLIYIFIFYLLFYGIYLLITFILSKGELFLFHPFVRPLLDVSPFPELIKFGIFKLLDGLFISFTMSPFFKAFFNVQITIYIFSYENIKYIFNLISPNLGDKIVEFMEKHKGKKTEEIELELKAREEEKQRLEKEKKENEDKDEVRAITSINKGVEVEIANNLKQTTPDLDATESNKIFIENNNLVVNTYSKKIGDYIKLNYK